MVDREMKNHGAGDRTYIITWAGLLVLTVLTVTVSKMHLGEFSLIAAVVIASVKAWLVLNIFMHLRYEKKIFKIMFLVAIVTLAVFIGMTFFDVLYR